MRILVTNDDGINARGLWTLAEQLREVGEVTVVAPDREQSGIGAAVTLHHPLRITRVKALVAGVEAYSIDGTPADSVILALGTVMKEKVDLIVSGINEGSNLGDDVLISGTVGAALQGYFRGFPSLAVSVAALEDAHFEAGARLTVLLASKIAAALLPRRILLNINLPNLPLADIQGIELTRLAQRSYTDTIQEGHDGRKKYYWIMRAKLHWNSEEGTDIWALERNRISITPLHADLSDAGQLSQFRALCPSLLQELQSVPPGYRIRKGGS
jgi:5'-nucleotidase